MESVSGGEAEDKDAKAQQSPLKSAFSEDEAPDTDWCTYEEYRVKYCDPIYNDDEKKANWHMFLRALALDTLVETENHYVRNKRNS